VTIKNDGVVFLRAWTMGILSKPRATVLSRMVDHEIHQLESVFISIAHWAHGLTLSIAVAPFGGLKCGK
jgi:choline-glycine betaine transporter